MAWGSVCLHTTLVQPSVLQSCLTFGQSTGHCCAVNFYVPHESAVYVGRLASSCWQPRLSATLENVPFNSLLPQNSLIDQSCLLYVSSSHAFAWLSDIPSPGPYPNEHQMAIKWYLGIHTSPGSPSSALSSEHPLDLLRQHALMCEHCW